MDEIELDAIERV